MFNLLCLVLFQMLNMNRIATILRPRKNLEPEIPNNVDQEKISERSDVVEFKYTISDKKNTIIRSGKQ